MQKRIGAIEKHSTKNNPLNTTERIIESDVFEAKEEVEQLIMLLNNIYL